MQVKFVNYQKDYLKYKEDYDAAWESVNMRGDLILRKDVDEFEQRLADYVGTKYAIALSSGTDALLIALKSFGVKDISVAVPSHTFKSTCGAVLSARGVPVIYDMGKTGKEETYIVAHIAGELYDIPTGRRVIEDACQAIGAVKNPKTYAQCWSFYPAKILGCKGDAGAITTNNIGLYNYAKEYRNHFKGGNELFGGNHRMDNLQAALLNVKIQHLDEILARRKEIAEEYLERLQGVELPNNQSGRVWQDFIVRTLKRDELYEYLKEHGIETMKNEYPFTPKYPKLSVAARYEAETLRIPCNEHLTEEEVDYVIEVINRFAFL